MEIMFWAFGGVAALAIGIIAVAGWIVFVRDRDAPNARSNSEARKRKVRRPRNRTVGRTRGGG